MEIVSAAVATFAPLVVAARGLAVHKNKEQRPLPPAKKDPTSPLDLLPATRKAVAASSQHQGKGMSLEAPEGEHRIGLHGQVYDITRFHATHPGGKIILAYSGRDATDAFELFHPPRVRVLLEALRLGPMASGPDGTEASAATRDYRTLRKALWEEGRFVPNARYFAWQQLLAFVLIGISVALLLLLPDWTIVHALLAPCFLGLGLKQAAFLGHDTLHNGVLAARGKTRTRQLLGQLNAGVIFGISMNMWLDEHNAHHAYTLRPHADPQFTYFPLWLQSCKELTMWRAEIDALPKGLARSLTWRLTKGLVRIQHLTWLPLSVVIGRINLCLISFGYAAARAHWADCAAMCLHAIWYTAFVTCLLPATFWSRFLFVLVHFSWTGVLHVQLLLSHLMMQQFDEREEVELGLFRFQLLTTRNIDSAWGMRWFHGGLDMQIEHHLFPMLPRHQLHDVAPRVKALAEKHSLPYTQLGFFEAIGVCLGELHRMSTALVYESIA